MAKIIVVTSGKGGVGKTTSSAAIGTGIAMRGFKTVIIDFDIGLRNLDLIMGCERRVVYDFVNVINGEANLKQALIKDKRIETLFILPASQTRDKDALSKEGVERILNELAEELRKIRKLDEFNKVSFSKRKKFTNPTYARLIKLDEIYQSIKIGNISITHSLYSNHIHSEYISIRQLKSAVNNNSQYESSFSTVTLLCSRITSLVITNIIEKYDLEKSSYSKAPLILKKIIESINKISSELK